MSQVDKRNPQSGTAGIRYHKVFGADDLTLSVEPPTVELEVPVFWYEPAEDETWETAVTLNFPVRDDSPVVETPQGTPARISADGFEYEATRHTADHVGVEAFARNHVRVVADDPQEATAEFERMWLNGKHVVADGKIWKRVKPRPAETGTPVTIAFDWRAAGTGFRKGTEISAHIPSHDDAKIITRGGATWTNIGDRQYHPTGNKPDAKGVAATITRETRSKDASTWPPDESVRAKSDDDALVQFRKRWLEGRLITINGELWAEVDRI